MDVGDMSGKAAERADEVNDLEERVMALEQCLGIRFGNRLLARQALLHRSAVLERERESRPVPELPSNERLEFLGDAVVNMLMAEFAFHRFPECDEGRLTEIRSALARRSSMTMFAESIGLGSFVIMSRAEARKGTRGHATVLAEAMEAVIAAIYLDQGFAAVSRLVHDMLARFGDGLLRDAEAANAKSRLQQVAQSRFRTVPSYVLVSRSGPAHDSRFDVQVQIGDLNASGQGTSRQGAEQHAAAALLLRLQDAASGEPLAATTMENDGTGGAR